MPILPFPEYRPDLSDYEGQATRSILNVLPRADGYGPWADFSALSAALAAQCRGAFYARKADGSVQIFAGTSTKLYTMSNTDFTWSDVSKAAGTYTTIPTGDQWQFRQFGKYVFAVQINAPVQVYDLTSSSAFADLAGSPPQARYISVVNRFLVLSGLGSSTPYRIHWSGYNDTTRWTVGINLSDFQDIPDGGIVRTVADGETGIVTQDSAIRRITYEPGTKTVFRFDRISEDKGILAPLSMVRAGDRVFYIGNDGFQMIVPGGYPQPIGKEKVSATFLADLDTSALQYCIGAADPRASRVYWSYRSASDSTTGFNKIICYDYALERWSIISTAGEYLATMAAPGTTLENLDSINSSIDALTFSLDDVSTGALSRLGAVNTAHKLGFYSGSNVEATLVTASRGGDGRRIRVRSLRPITDATSVFASVSKRETQHAAEVYSTESAMTSYGVCPQNVSTRFARGKARIPAGTSWTFASGLEPEVSIEGRR